MSLIFVLCTLKVIILTNTLLTVLDMFRCGLMTIYMEEEAREQSLGFPKCRCSNCEAAAAANLWANLPFASLQTFDQIVNDTFTTDQNAPNRHPSKIQSTRKRKITAKQGPFMDAFKSQIVEDFTAFHAHLMGKEASIQGPDVLGDEELEVLLCNFPWLKPS